jgi:Zn-dependent peptidase ImmA (M78 family)
MTAESLGRAAAENFRREHRLGTQPIADLVSTIELVAGIDVAILDANPDQHGMAVRDPARDAVIIAAARTRNPMRQRSTLAHELGHVLFGDFTAQLYEGRSPEEIRADTFARHLLVPVEALHETFQDRAELTAADLSAVVQRFMASPSLVALQFNQAGLIDAALCQEWRALSTPQLATRFGWSDQYAALQAESFQRRAPQRLLARAIDGYRAGVVSSSAIARLRRLSTEQVEAELRDAGVIPIARTVQASAPHADLDIDLSDLDDLDVE